MKRRIEKHLEEVRSPDSRVRARGWDALERIGTKAVPEPLVHALADPNVYVRRISMWLLSHLADPGTAAALLESVRDPDSLVRQWANAGLHKMKGAKVRAVLILGLGDSSWEVRAAAARQLARFRGAEEALRRAAADPDERVRAEAPPTRAALRDPSPLVRERAVRLLPDLKPIFAALLDADHRVRRAAAYRLKGKPRRAMETILEGLRDPNADVRLRAVDVASLIPGTVDALCRALRDPDVRVRRAAASRLSDLQDLNAIDALQAAMRDEDPEVRAHASSGVDKLRED